MNIFSNFQFRFRKTHSTSHACTLQTIKITESFNSKQKILGIFLDLSKAFDTIDHTTLLSKLYHYGISEAYLCNGSKATSETGNNRSKLITHY